MDRMTPGEQLSERYPDPLIKVLDKSFAKYQLPHGGVERLATGTRWIAITDTAREGGLKSQGRYLSGDEYSLEGRFVVVLTQPSAHRA